MRVLIIITHMGAGGTERNAANLTNCLTEKGCDVRILTLLQKPLIFSIDRRAKIVCCGAEVSHRSRSSHAVTKALQIPRCLTQIRKQAEEYRPDVVVSLLVPADLMVYTLRSIYRKKAIGRVCWITSERNDPTRRKPYLQYLLKRIYRKADLLVCQTGSVQVFYGEGVHSCVLPNIVDTAVLPSPVEEIRTGEQQDMLEFVSAGRFVPQKNYGMLVRAFAAACEQTSVKMHLTIYGEGGERKKLQEWIRSSGMSDKISLPGVSTELHEKVRTAAAYLVSSDYEGVSNALLEAVLLGVPVISTDWKTGGARELTDEKTGILVPTGDREAMTEAIVRMAEDETLRRQMREHNRALRLRYEREEQAEEKWFAAVLDAVIRHGKRNGKHP
ncbi:MAG: glycosyltransferase [Eubacterium sp.]|nr:glycosyltransferase [Eubacterium sp.]